MVKTNILTDNITQNHNKKTIKNFRIMNNLEATEGALKKLSSTRKQTTSKTNKNSPVA